MYFTSPASYIGYFCASLNWRLTSLWLQKWNGGLEGKMEASGFRQERMENIYLQIKFLHCSAQSARVLAWTLKGMSLRNPLSLSHRFDVLKIFRISWIFYYFCGFHCLLLYLNRKFHQLIVIILNWISIQSGLCMIYFSKVIFKQNLTFFSMNWM